jgi:hypothetical protein
MFSELPKPRKRFSAFSGSGLLHSVLIGVLASVPVGTLPRASEKPKRYPVRFLYLQTPRIRRETAPAKASAAKSDGRKLVYRQPVSQTEEHGDAEPAKAASAHYRPFELPPTTLTQPVKQTLVQPDLPRNIALKNDLAVPAMLLWTQKDPPPYPARKFVAPPLKEIAKVQRSLPSAPALNPPNGETVIADVRLANVPINDLPRLPQMPATTSPVHTPGPEVALKIPQIVLPDPSEANIANVISIPDVPVRASNLVVLPPVNQIAPQAVAGAGTGTGQGGGGGAQSLASARAGLAAPGLGGVQSGTDDGKSGSRLGNAASVGGAGTTVVVGAAGGSANSVGAAAGAGGALGFDTREVTRLTLPKEGQYGVVVMGSEAAAPYPESTGALGGKMVYTVYLKVGLRKSWILQYCLPNGVAPKTHVAGTGTPFEAPYPFFIMRPNTLDSQEPDYVLVHGIVTVDGKFDRLTLIFPVDLEKKSLLLNSLKLWEFRPAKRDGEKTEVEVLLIIPRQS